jgi:hypothetical protein
MLEGEAAEKEKARATAEASDRARNSHLYDVQDASKTAGTLTVTPGTLSFEPRKANEKKNMIIQCSEIKRIEQGQSAFVLPHVNLFMNPVNGKERMVMFYTSTPATGGFFTPIKPGTNITADVINAIIQACGMARINN